MPTLTFCLRSWSCAWTAAIESNRTVDAFQDLVRNLDVACVEAEQSRDLSLGAVGRRRAELCDQALKKLVNFPPFEIAKRAISGNIAELERLSDRSPEQVRVLGKLERALGELQEGVEATRRMVLERCRMREGAMLKSA